MNPPASNGKLIDSERELFVLATEMDDLDGVTIIVQSRIRSHGVRFRFAVLADLCTNQRVTIMSVDRFQFILSVSFLFVSLQALRSDAAIFCQDQNEPDSAIFSGPQTGEPLPSLQVNPAAGVESSESLDLIKKAANGPVVIVFMHERTRPAFGLTNVVMKFAATRRDKGLTAATVFLTADQTETENWIKRTQQNQPKDVILAISPDGLEGPGDYGLNRNVALTIIVANEGKVTANFALVQPGLDVDGPKILKAIGEVTGGGPVPPVSTFMRQQMDARRGGEKPRDGDTAQTEQQDPMLRPLLSRVISRTATDEQVDAAATEVIKYASAHPVARRQIADIANRIISADKLSNYGTPKAQDYLKQWAVEFKKPLKKESTEPSTDKK